MASNRAALRRLSRKLPAPPEVAEIMENLRKKSDTESAIVAAAICESYLEELLKAKLKYRDPNIEGRIFLNRGPLSDFDSKILIARAFAIITSPLAEEMHSIQAIRNAFAHTKVHIDLNHELIDREIKNLRMPTSMLLAQTASEPSFSNKNVFLLVTQIVLILLDEFTTHHGS